MGVEDLRGYAIMHVRSSTGRQTDFNTYFLLKWTLTPVVTKDLSEAELKTLLDDCRRRYALYCLFRYAAPMTLPTVADCVTELEYGAPAETLLEERLCVYMSLYHEHVPRLAEAGIVEYHQEEDSVDLAENASVIKPQVVSKANHEFGEQWPQILTNRE